MRLKKKAAAIALAAFVMFGAGLVTAPAASANPFLELRTFNDPTACGLWRTVRVATLIANGNKIMSAECYYTDKMSSFYVWRGEVMYRK